jgi:transcription elongation factor SPT5
LGSQDVLEHEYESDEEGKNLPSVYDPKLWRVRVKKGFERTAAMALMNKQIDFTKNLSTPKPFAIYSATHIDSIDNFIFVEAHKIDSVRDAIQGLSFCFSSKIDILQDSEMTKIYEENKGDFVRPKENQFVRIKSGLYGGDIGIVYSVKTDDAIWIKLVPRVDPSPKSKKDNKR